MDAAYERGAASAAGAPAKAPEQLHDLLPNIFQFVHPAVFALASASSCKRLSFAWYLRLFPRVVLVPDEAPTINAAINRLAREGDAFACEERRGLVLVRPGTYLESVRVTQNCFVLGAGAPGRVIVEAPGWESALVFSGLGIKGFGSGEDSYVGNITFRCRNEQMRGRCVYIVLGQPLIDRCAIEGGVVVGGRKTAPQFHCCSVRGSWGSGLHLTDHCRSSIRETLVESNRRHGILVDRGSCPEIVSNAIRANGACGLRLFCGTSASKASSKELPAELEQLLMSRISGNELEANGEGDVCTTPRFADSHEMAIDHDDYWEVAEDEAEEDRLLRHQREHLFAPGAGGAGSGSGEGAGVGGRFDGARPAEEAVAPWQAVEA